MSTNDIHVCKFHKDDSSACLSCGLNSSVNEAYPVEVAENLSRSDISDPHIINAIVTIFQVCD